MAPRIAVVGCGRWGQNHVRTLAELGALAESVVEEFEDMGRPVTLDTEGRVVAPVHLTWLKRGLRNLITNALRYAGTARVTILREDGHAVLRVDDDGPGIPADRIQDMLEPFTRGEASRNRETGGANDHQTAQGDDWQHTSRAGPPKAGQEARSDPLRIAHDVPQHPAADVRAPSRGRNTAVL